VWAPAIGLPTPFSAKYLFKKVLAKDSTKGPKIKATMPLTLNPGTSSDANQKQIPLTTSENTPRVRNVIGNDKRERIGLTKPLTSPIDNAAINAAGKVAIATPGTIISTTNSPNAVINVVRKNPSILFFQIQLNDKKQLSKHASIITKISALKPNDYISNCTVF